jgi:hypothetical protein
MRVLIRFLAATVPLVAVPALAAGPAATGITSVRPALFLFVVAAALFLALVLRSMLDHLLGMVMAKLGDLRVRRVLHRQSRDVLHDCILPGAYGGLTKIDHAILTAGGILCIRAKHCNGLVFGAEDEPQWTNVDGTARRRFLNPLIQNESRTRALRSVVPDVPVANLVVFTGAVEFPTPVPKNVIHVSQLGSYIEKYVFGPSRIEDWDAVWMTLRSAALTDEASRKDFEAQIA